MAYHFPESFSLAFILAERRVHHQQGPWIRIIGQKNPETNPITIKPETEVLLGSLTLLPSAEAPFPSNISCFVSMCTSLDNSLPSVRRELDKSSLSGPGRGPPSCNS